MYLARDDIPRLSRHEHELVLHWVGKRELDVGLANAAEQLLDRILNVSDPVERRGQGAKVRAGELDEKRVLCLRK